MATAVKAKSTQRKKAAGRGAIRTYRSAVSYLNSAVNYERTPPPPDSDSPYSLNRMQRLLTALGNPHKEFRSAHVAGTKGKGSTVSMLARMLEASGYKVGTYMSPHVMDVRERVAINGKNISEAEFTRLMNKVIKASQSPRVSQPTYFEIMTAIAFLYFAASEVDIAIVETGLGGRLDATNVIRPEVVGITSISLDHTQQLGSTLAEVAREKAGVFKSGVPVISSQQREEVTKVLRAVAGDAGSPLRMTGRENGFSYRFESSRATGPHIRICLNTPSSHFEHVRSPLMGDHQAFNCAVALGMLDILKSRGFEIDERRSVEGLTRVSLPGRMEMIRTEPRVLVDGAHNASSVEALVHAIGQNVPYDSMVIIFGCHKDKDIDGMLKQIRLGADKIIFTSTTSVRSADPFELASRFSEMSSKMCQVADDLREAMSIAERAVTREDLICITGSFYLVGRAKRLFSNHKKG